MNTKLTLTIQQEIIAKAKEYARDKNRSLSDIIENYLKLLTSKSEEETEKLQPIVKSLRGAFKTDKELNYKEELQKRREEKYL